MTWQSGKQTIATDTLPNISRRQSDHEVDQLIEHNIEHILEKSYIKCGREIFRDPFLNNQIEHISGSIV